MGRRRSIFTKTNLKAISKKSKKQQAVIWFVISLFYAIISVFAFLFSNEFFWYPLIPTILCAFLSISNTVSYFDEEKNKKIYKQKLLNSSIADTDCMDGVTFENFCYALFEKLGYKVQKTSATGDYGVDLIISKNEISQIGQCKRFSKKVSISAIQEISAARAHYKIHKAFVITNNYFTKPAINLAISNNIQLIDRDNLIDLILKANEVKESANN